MTPDQIELVASVIDSVAERPEFATRFYERLFEVAPQTADMFPDVVTQRQKLADELRVMVSLLSDLGSLETRARDLGERHRGYGVRAAHYRIARVVMADTLHDVLGDQFGPAEEDAWNRATSLITELMQATS